MTAVSCKDLNKTFTQGEQIIKGLDGVTIDIQAGEFVCLSGPSGSGKTTLLNAMGGLDTPDSGEILVGGQRVDQLDKGDLADMRLNNIGKYIEDFQTVYNQAWAGHGVPKMAYVQAKSLMFQLKPIIDEKIVWFGYYNDEPIAFFIMIPEANQIFKYVNGKLDWLGKLKFVWHKWRKTCNKMFGLVFGIVPDHQGKGVEGALIMAARQMVQDDYHRYEDLELNWIGDFNPKMLRVVEQVGGKIGKTHITYRKLFDQSKEFKRHRFI